MTLLPPRQRVRPHERGELRARQPQLAALDEVRHPLRCADQVVEIPVRKAPFNHAGVHARDAQFRLFDQNRVHILPLLPVGSLLLLVQIGCFMVLIEGERDKPAGNTRPEVRIAGGAASSDPSGIDHKIQFQRHGTDADGVVVEYQYAY